LDRRRAGFFGSRGSYRASHSRRLILNNSALQRASPAAVDLRIQRAHQDALL